MRGSVRRRGCGAVAALVALTLVAAACGSSRPSVDAGPVTTLEPPPDAIPLTEEFDLDITDEADVATVPDSLGDLCAGSALSTIADDLLAWIWPGPVEIATNEATLTACRATAEASGLTARLSVEVLDGDAFEAAITGREDGDLFDLTEVDWLETPDRLGRQLVNGDRTVVQDVHWLRPGDERVILITAVVIGEAPLPTDDLPPVVDRIGGNAVAVLAQLDLSPRISSAPGLQVLREIADRILAGEPFDELASPTAVVDLDPQLEFPVNIASVAHRVTIDDCLVKPTYLDCRVDAAGTIYRFELAEEFAGWVLSGFETDPTEPPGGTEEPEPGDGEG